MNVLAKVGLLVTLLLALSRTAPAQPLVSSNTTVVLLVSLPGDLPSERTYREQTERWLQWLAGLPQPPQQIHLLWDAEPFPSGPSRLRLQTHLARRDEFLKLADALGPQTNDLLFIAWGHGGFQRTTPVLHVRGPRLTAEDFKRLTNRPHQAKTTCLLLFRGSGQTAKTLAQETLTILSSENEVPFQNDPIAMDLLLQALRPNSPLKELSDRLGQATAEWYQSRQLARTEEPTLWIGKEQPRSLVSAAPVKDAATLTPPPLTTSTPPPEPAANVPDNPENAPSERWIDLRPVDANEYSEWDGVILRQKVNYTIADQPAIDAEHEIFLQILTPAGLRYADFNFEYSPPGEELEVVDAEVRRPNGEIVQIDPAGIRESIADAEPGYAGRRYKFFSLPGAEAGAILHVRYRSTWREFPLPHVSLPIPISLELPVKELALQVEVPRKTPLHFRFQELSAPDPVVLQREYGTRFSWALTDVYPLPDEPFVSPNRQPSLLLSTWPDWKTFASWYDRISRLADTITPEIEETAQKLTADLETDQEKVRALSEYVTRLRYVAVPLGVNSFRPHAAANVLNNQFGDCKDKANLFNAMLRSLKIDAHLVLVPRFAQAYSSLPGFAFNHALSQVNLPNQSLWIDTTDDLCQFGLLPPGDSGRSVLVIDGKTTELTSLPQAHAGDHGLQLNAEIQFTPAHPSSTMWKARARGYLDYALRTAADRRSGRSTITLLSDELDLHNSVFVCTNQMFTPYTDLATNFAWQATGETIGLTIPLATTNVFVLRAPIWLPEAWSQTLQPRTSPLYLNQGYPLQLHQEIVFRLASSAARILKVPEARSQLEAPLRWKFFWEQPSADQLVAHLELDLEQGELDRTRTLQFQGQLRALYEAFAAGPVLQGMRPSRPQAVRDR